MTNKPVILIKLFLFRFVIKEPYIVSKPPVIDKTKMHEYVELVLKEEVQKEIKKHNIDSVVRSVVQRYQQGDAQEVLTREQSEALIASSMEKMMDQLQEKMDKCNKQKENRNNCNDQEYALLRSILYVVLTLCEFLFLSVHVSFIINNLSFNPILITLLINRTLTH